MVISETLAQIMVEALREVVKSGTAVTLSWLTQPLACKTGTTNNFTDALIFCFTPDITMGVWMGGPENYKKSLGEKEFGARTAVALKHIVENWYQGREPNQFLEESKEWKKLLKIPNLFQKELEEINRLEAEVDTP